MYPSKQAEFLIGVLEDLYVWQQNQSTEWLKALAKKYGIPALYQFTNTKVSIDDPLYVYKKKKHRIPGTLEGLCFEKCDTEEKRAAVELMGPKLYEMYHTEQRQERIRQRFLRAWILYSRIRKKIARGERTMIWYGRLNRYLYFINFRKIYKSMEKDIYTVELVHHRLLMDVLGLCMALHPITFGSMLGIVVVMCLDMMVYMVRETLIYKTDFQNVW